MLLTLREGERKCEERERESEREGTIERESRKMKQKERRINEKKKGKCINRKCVREKERER